MTQNEQPTPTPLANDLIPSDAWVLLALLLAGKDAPREKIVEAGDYVNHAIFTDEELDGGLARLERIGCIIRSEAGHSVSDEVQQWYEADGPKRRNVFQDLERVEDFLGVSRT